MFAAFKTQLNILFDMEITDTMADMEMIPASEIATKREGMVTLPDWNLETVFIPSMCIR